MSMLLSLALVAVGLAATALLATLWLVLKAAVSQEAAAVIPEASRSLLKRAKERLPLDAQPRWEEEWPAGFEQAIERRPIWALREALSLYLGAGRIARELEPSTVVAGRGWGRVGALGSSAIARFGRFGKWFSQITGIVREINEGLAFRLEQLLGAPRLGLLQSRLLRFATYILWAGILLMSLRLGLFLGEWLIG